ncbi:hypothetical protein C8R46DRAFT_1341726 [Mycena filopes]|nr:hypothetical protein C8R46DRAFT_1341726 [Mycena filopes]
MPASALTQLVSFLTRPLMRSHTPTTIIALQLALTRAFSSPSPSSFESTAFLLSPHCPPPAPIQRACLLTGVRWADWIALLSNGVEVRLYLTATALSVKVGRMPRRTLWLSASVAAPIKSTALALMLVPAAQPLASRLRAAATLTCTRAQRGAALNPTRIPTLLSCAISSSVDDDCEESDSEESEFCESDEDSEDDFSSASSATSVSSTSVRAACAADDAEVVEYSYEGGRTRVMSGGVMLGAATSAPVLAPAPAWVAPAQLRRSRADAVSSWRKTAA